MPPAGPARSAWLTRVGGTVARSARPRQQPQASGCIRAQGRQLGAYAPRVTLLLARAPW